MAVSQKILEEFISSHELPESFLVVARDHYLPIAAWIAADSREAGHRVLGINGSQGSGKSTLASFLECTLAAEYELNVVTLSIDDLYFTRSERQYLARDIHPLLLTRGVPGTHDTELGIRLMNELAKLQNGDSLSVPRFDKRADDRMPETHWDRVSGPVDILLFEGWCVGSTAQLAVDLDTPVNELESDQDVDGRWRRYVNRQLNDGYADLFSRIDRLLFLQMPDMHSVRRWKLQQEQKLVSLTQNESRPPMSSEEVKHFVEYFERITLHNLTSLPGTADVIVKLNPDHGVRGVEYAS
jgi:D-glycerate 3-kinase